MAAKVETYFRRVLNTNPGFGSALADVDYSRGCYRSARAYLNRYFKVAQPTRKVLLLTVRVER